MAKYEFKAKCFKRMDDPLEREDGKVKYVCYAKANTLPDEFLEWMRTNPREQKMTTNVAKNIMESLANNEDFHELNRGILMSAQSVSYDNKNETVLVELNNPDIHGNIDGGHTLRAILTLRDNDILNDERYVFLEIFTGIDSPVELAAARNTSVQVDTKSIEELQKSFEPIKNVLKDLPFSSRVAYKMNEHFNESGVRAIDVKDILSIIMMFSQTVYPYKDKDGTLSDLQPTQCYSGKEATLKKFINIDKKDRESMIENMSDIISDIFDYWDMLELNFCKLAYKTGKNYRLRKYSKIGKTSVNRTLFSDQEIDYFVPRGLIFPIVGSFRALVCVDSKTNKYYWKKDPKLVFNKLASKLVGIVLDEKNDNPDSIAKNTNLWSNLFKEVYIEGHIN